MIDAVGINGLTYSQLCERYNMAFSPKSVAKLCDIIGRTPEYFIRTSKADFLKEKGIIWDASISKKPPTFVYLSESGIALYNKIQNVIEENKGKI